MPHNPSLSGAARVGFIRMILADGFSGIAVIIWDDEFQGMMNFRSSDGKI